MLQATRFQLREHIKQAPMELIIPHPVHIQDWPEQIFTQDVGKAHVIMAGQPIRRQDFKKGPLEYTPIVPTPELVGELGFLAYGIYNVESNGILFKLHSIVVAPYARRQGIGEMLMSALVEKVKSYPRALAYGETSSYPSLKPMRRLFERSGFSHVYDRPHSPNVGYSTASYEETICAINLCFSSGAH